jgi:hypothetical protein
MNILLAQLPAPTSHEAIGWLVVGFAALCVAAKQIFGLVKDIRGKAPHPPNEQLGQSHMDLTRRVVRVEQSVDDLARAQKEDIENLREEGRVRGNDLYEKIDSVRQELKGDTIAQTRHIEDRIENMPERVIATLKNAGALDRHKER